MTEFDKLVPIPPWSEMNQGLSSCREDTMLNLLGRPGDLTEKCSRPTGDITQRLKYGVDVGPFKISGLDYAVESLIQVLAAARETAPETVAALKTAGMLCVRCIKHSPSHYSNHSWGCAIDLYFGAGVVPMGTRLCQQGFLDLYPVFNRFGWYWGAGFSGNSVDSMHFEIADETAGKIPQSMQPDALVAANEYISDMGYDVLFDDA